MRNEEAIMHMNNYESIQRFEQSGTEPRTREHAEAKISVQSSEVKPYDHTVNPALMEIRLRETFTGAMDGESPVRALQILRSYASLVSIQRFSGKLGGRGLSKEAAMKASGFDFRYNSVQLRREKERLSGS
jgi:hypothetical protein